jgi:hypothetical protein
MSQLKNQIPNQEYVERQIRSLFRNLPSHTEVLTPTQRFVLSDLKEALVKHDGKGKEDFTYWELRKLKDTKAVFLASVVGTVKRYILIGPRGHLQQLQDESEAAQLKLADVLERVEQGNA